MDLFRLPPSLRRSLLSRPVIRQALRTLTTSTLRNAASDQPLSNDSHTTPNHDLAPPLTSDAPLPALLTLSPSTLNTYHVSLPPTPAQLHEASRFFTAQLPTLLFTRSHFRDLPPSPFPEVAILGRSNVGKSSLLNALINQPTKSFARVSKRPGRTRTMNGYGIGGPGLVGARKADDDSDKTLEAWRRFAPGGLVVLDMPGYGAGSRKDWGVEAMKYLERRTQLRRTFVLVDAEHGLKETDVALLTHLRRNGLPCQVILSKIDKLLYPSARLPSPTKLHDRLMALREQIAKLQRRLDEAAGEGGRKMPTDVLCCSAEKSLDVYVGGTHRKIGIDEVRWAMLTACGLEKT